MNYRILVSATMVAAGLAACGDANELNGEHAGAGSIGGAPDSGAGGFEDTGGAPGAGGDDGGRGGGGGEGLDPASNRAGTISILELAVSNPEVSKAGAEVDITYRDLDAPHVTPIGTPGKEGSCAVYVYDVERDPDPTDALMDEGSVAWAIPEPHAYIFTCAFDSPSGRYRCPVLSETIDAQSLVTTSTSGTMQLTAFNQDGLFTGLDLAGMFVEIEGLENPAFNGRFPIIKHDSDYIIHVENPAAAFEPTEIVADGAALTIYAGEGPTTAERDFLGAPNDTIYMDKDEGPDVPRFDTQVLHPAGENLTLVNGTPQPHEFPDTPQDLTFTCDRSDIAGAGNCGQTGGTDERLILEGRTTDGGIGDLAKDHMPKPTGAYATFRCLGVTGEPTVTMAAPFVEAVLATDATRVETRLLRVSVNEVAPATTILTGHGLVGYTDIP